MVRGHQLHDEIEEKEINDRAEEKEIKEVNENNPGVGELKPTQERVNVTPIIFPNANNPFDPTSPIFDEFETLQQERLGLTRNSPLPNNVTPQRPVQRERLNTSSAFFPQTPRSQSNRVLVDGPDEKNQDPTPPTNSPQSPRR